MKMTKLAFRVVIPARYASSRLPGKPLLPLAGKPMVVRVWERALKCGAEEVLVATDDERILAAVKEAGGEAIMTSPDHPSGTDRLAEVVERLEWPEETIVVNLQGDEPLIPGSILRDLAAALDSRPDAGIATMATPILDSDDFFDPNVVKVVRAESGLALYFSRAPIPWARDEFADGKGASRPLPEGIEALRHLGLYAYRARTLRRLVSEPPAALELFEKLEQLRAMALGIPIHVGVLDEAPGHGVDTHADLERVFSLFAASEA